VQRLKLGDGVGPDDAWGAVDDGDAEVEALGETEPSALALTVGDADGVAPLVAADEPVTEGPGSAGVGTGEGVQESTSELVSLGVGVGESDAVVVSAPVGERVVLGDPEGVAVSVSAGVAGAEALDEGDAVAAGLVVGGLVVGAVVLGALVFGAAGLVAGCVTGRLVTGGRTVITSDTIGAVLIGWGVAPSR
jgi:hypothetical protein